MISKNNLKARIISHKKNIKSKEQFLNDFRNAIREIKEGKTKPISELFKNND